MQIFLTALLSMMILSGKVNANGDMSIPEFNEFAPGLYRGGQPSGNDYAELKKLGIKTIVNFRHEKNWIESDAKEAEKYGFRYESIPWTIYGKPDLEPAEKLFQILEDKEAYPVFIHCKRGVERTGVMAAAYYVRYQNMSYDEAHQKAFKGFPVKMIWKPFINRQFDFLKDKVSKE